MSYNLILNSSNVVGVNNNQFKYNFIGGSFTVPEGSELSISQITIPYSWYNVSSALGNNTFQYMMPTGSTMTTTTVTLQDGFYQLSDLNNALNASLKANNYYFYNLASPSIVGYSDIPSSQIIYPIQFVANASYYTNSVVFQYIPSTAPNVVTQFGTGWLWANAATFPTHAQLPMLVIPQQGGANISQSTYGMGNILGFTNGTYPSASNLYYGLATTNTTDTPTITNSYPLTINGNSLKSYSYIGSANTITITGANPVFSALGTYVNGVVVRCNLVENNVTMPSDIVDTFPITSTFGSNINYLPITDNSVKLKQGKFSSITISFSDQNFNTLLCQDPNVLISLLIHFPAKK